MTLGGRLYLFLEQQQKRNWRPGIIIGGLTIDIFGPANRDVSRILDFKYLLMITFKLLRKNEKKKQTFLTKQNIRKRGAGVSKVVATWKF